MNPQKFKEWLLKIDNAHIEKVKLILYSLPKMLD